MRWHDHWLDRRIARTWVAAAVIGALVVTLCGILHFHGDALAYAEMRSVATDEDYERGIERIQNVGGLLLLFVAGIGLFACLRYGIRRLRGIF